MGEATAKPWPHGWRQQMRLRPVPEQDLPPAVIYRVTPTWLICTDASGGIEHGASIRVDRRMAHVQPDLDDDATKGVMLGMVREALGDPWYSLDAFTHPDPAIGTRWYEPTTSRGFASDGVAYVAALDRLAKEGQ